MAVATELLARRRRAVASSTESPVSCDTVMGSVGCLWFVMGSARRGGGGGACGAVVGRLDLGAVSTGGGGGGGAREAIG